MFIVILNYFETVYTIKLIALLLLFLHYQMYQCAQSAITANNLNLPVYDIHEKQARDQILFNFHTLANTTAAISERHMQKCKEQNERIQALRQRILRCKERVETLTGLNQAIVFVSPSQYPTKYDFNTEEKKSKFSDYLQRTHINKLDMKAQYIVKHDINQLGKAAKLTIKDLDEFVLFMFGKLKGKRKTIFQKGISNKKQIENLGRIPSNIRYIDSLTVFNTHINPYKKYEVSSNVVKIDHLQNKQKKQEQNQLMTNDSVLNNNLTPFEKKDNIADDMKYIKKEDDFQEIEFDENLGDFGLGNIVDISTAYNDDISFKNAKKKNVIQDNVGKKKVQTGSDIFSTNAGSQTSSNSSTFNLPPPPSLNLPPPPSLNLAPPPSLKLPPPPSLNLPPPPSLNLPPPPILNLPPPPALNLAPPPIGLPPALSAGIPAAGGRADLLKEIENPNPMARLKKTVTKQYSGVKGMHKSNTSAQENNGGNGNNDEGSNAQPMDLMAALKARIRTRFKVLHPDES